jgi:hypothetical protein
MLSFDGGQGQREWHNDRSDLALSRNPGKIMPPLSWLLYSGGRRPCTMRSLLGTVVSCSPPFAYTPSIREVSFRSIGSADLAKESAISQPKEGK